MMGRISRLTRVELMKLALHPFLWVALGLLVGSTLAAAVIQTGLSGAGASEWRSVNAIQVFSYGARFGLRLASFVLVIFGSLLFAGEFDRGTIKILLTRPVTRTDLYAAKCLAALILGALLVLVVLWLSFVFGCARGELGPVWSGEEYLVQSSYEELEGHAIRAVRMSLWGVLASAFLGIAVSCFFDSSGFAVAVAMTLFIGLDLVTGLFGGETQERARYVFSFYPSYALDVLKAYAEGTSALWKDKFEPLYWTVPTVSMIGFAAVGYVGFRFRQILA